MDKKQKPLIVLGLLGPVLDSGRGVGRWDKWRPTVSLCRHDDLLVARLVLLHQPRFAALFDGVKEDIARVSPETAVVSAPLDLNDAWDFEQVYGALHDFARAYRFAPEDEDYLVHITTGTHVAQICLFLLTESRHFPARLLQTSPSPRAKSDPGSYAIIDLDLSKYDRLAARFRAEQKDAVSLLKAGIATKNKSFNRLVERIEHVAIASRDPILLTGPTGAGKSQLARRIYELKRARRQIQGEFVAVNCATLRGDAAMSALFGHVKGSFTGALAPRAGFLKTSDGGVLFLDEVGELGLDEQAMLLRAIEEKTFFPLGSDRAVQSDFVLIAGTNRDLARRVAEGTFRDDLLARINLWTFELPGLRDRPEDMAPNLDFELDKLPSSGRARTTMNREARDRFLAFAMSPDASWAGNFRDFGGAVVRMATLASSGSDGGRIDESHVDDEIARLRSAWSAAPTAGSSGPDLVAILGPRRLAALDRFDRVQLADVVDVCRSSPSLSAAGRILFAASRAKKESANDADRLRKYLARFDLAWKDVRNS